MKLFLLAPVFFFLLISKNISSWIAIFFGVFNTWTWYVGLILIQIGLGGVLLLSISWAQQTQKLVEKRTKHLEEHRQFWQEVIREFPTHSTAQKAAEVLEQLPQ